MEWAVIICRPGAWCWFSGIIVAIPASLTNTLAGRQGFFSNLWTRLERPWFMPQLCFWKLSLVMSIFLAVVLILLNSHCSASKKQNQKQMQECSKEFLFCLKMEDYKKSVLVVGDRWAPAYYNKESLIDCWRWPLDKAQLGQSFNDQIFLPEMAVCGRCQWKAQATQVQGNGKLGSCRQQQRHLQYFAQVLQQEWWKLQLWRERIQAEPHWTEKETLL